MLQDIKAVIFDLDGSLVDSMWIWKKIDIEYLERFGIRELPKNLQKEIEGKSFSETAIFFKEKFQIPDSLEQMKDDWNRMAWDKYMNDVPLKPGADRFLQYCIRNNIKLGIATSNSRQLVEAVADARGFGKDFDCIMTACEVAKGKPAPDIYLAVAKQLGVEPENCLVFEDIPAGVRAGLSAGMTVVGIEDSYGLMYKDEILELCNYYIKDYSEVLEGKLEVVYELSSGK